MDFVFDVTVPLAPLKLKIEIFNFQFYPKAVNFAVNFGSKIIAVVPFHRNALRDSSDAAEDSISGAVGGRRIII